jgi:tRNA threonylcarbamoyladenosine biosynthesis protein TsaE
VRHPVPGRMQVTRERLLSWGERFGQAARAPLVVAITGELGAGKTTLVQAICRGYGVTEPVTSPTFALVHQYASPRGAVYHLDLFRLHDPGEVTALGWDDIVTAEALVVIEWPERAGDRLPLDHVPIVLRHDPTEPSRRVLLAG